MRTAKLSPSGITTVAKSIHDYKEAHLSQMQVWHPWLQLRAPESRIRVRLCNNVFSDAADAGTCGQILLEGYPLKLEKATLWRRGHKH
jgi:hypothetical protein